MTASEFESLCRSNDVTFNGNVRTQCKYLSISNLYFFAFEFGKCLISLFVCFFHFITFFAVVIVVIISPNSPHHSHHKSILLTVQPLYCHRDLLAPNDIKPDIKISSSHESASHFESTNALFNAKKKQKTPRSVVGLRGSRLGEMLVMFIPIYIFVVVFRFVSLSNWKYRNVKSFTGWFIDSHHSKIH